ncbi:23S rRNA pseudouridine(1911/1915/1917) synthase RluD [Coxiella burnetii]|uniref:23S rRNA pseudouridine(1911/1915/1917) synthase RluD n=1 Tax=Coxiella burnetii TaxID=777 RepID=UPI0009B80E15|nr:23S rRNA pseudouridine(1911/1915/1917) synthase RluD [Coxiella burnetii]AZV75957.1 23S rRNA pseudouridine(1911/1915/1917) synthase RluD [Coxiella burnetii]MDE3401285.1 23S rRNA pseudouridine(1911/1915/1917) synthase RluD [Coxiella burnetii]PNT82625.1 23S rRNA pseudouridine(1911/1915/1917) synthase RluD [Coxiella burnetii]RQM57339.1 23S rRNA pseudouridine(1911/1915/1917) synthase RluD [Coxiella burnetii]RQM64499.1 23S rRNA pseudouridine(1911/1915/1917) synthase RluD [Coxiella burnetii]
MSGPMCASRIELKKIIPPELAGARLDQVLAKLFPDYSRSQLQNWIRGGHVKVDGIQKTKAREKVRENQFIEIEAQLEPNERWVPQPIPLDVIYEDETLLVINKPVGLIVHPGAGVRDQTLINALLHYDPSLSVVPRAGIIHRLDKDTSGLLLIARTLASHHALIKAMKARQIVREYEAIVKGVLISGRTIEAPVGRHPIHRTRMAVVEFGRPAITHFRIIKRYRAHTHIRVQLETGRTHQIRVHMAHIHHPLAGDPVYGSHVGIPVHLSDPLQTALKTLKRQALHAATLQFSHPFDQRPMACHAPLPADMAHLLECLEDDYSQLARS